jgi:hypothetical protein
MKILNRIRVEMDLQRKGRENMGRTDLVQGEDTWLALVKTPMTLRIAQNIRP